MARASTKWGRVACQFRPAVPTTGAGPAQRRLSGDPYIRACRAVEFPTGSSYQLEICARCSKGNSSLRQVRENVSFEDRHHELSVRDVIEDSCTLARRSFRWSDKGGPMVLAR